MTVEPGLVSLLTVNYNGRHLLADLLDSLDRQSYPRTEVLVVDNASTDDSVDYLRRRRPQVRLVQAPANLGFAGGNNLGMRHARGEFIALVNNDAFPESNWLEELVEEARAYPHAGAVASKILFLKPFVAVHLEADTYSPAAAGESSDGRLLGVMFDEESGFVGCDYRKPIFSRGFYGGERAGDRSVRWSAGEATVLLPVAERNEGAVLRLLLAAGKRADSCSVRVRVGQESVARLEVAPETSEHRVELPAHLVTEQAVDVINNAGSNLNGWGEAGDRGINQPDLGQFDDGGEVAAICGAATLLRRSALERVGLFDQDFFMYYEDTDLSWRLRNAGYCLRYRPGAVVRHVHAASSVEWSPGFTFHVARNKILMVAKNGSLGPLVRAYRRETGWCLRLLWYWLRGRGERQTLGRDLRVRLRVQRSLARQLPRAWMKRWGLLRPPALGRS